MRKDCFLPIILSNHERLLDSGLLMQTNNISSVRVSKIILWVKFQIAKTQNLKYLNLCGLLGS